MAVMEYQGYIGSVEFSEDDEVFHGRVLNTRDVITFEGRSAAELKEDFRGAIDVYVRMCQARGEEPEKPFSGKLNVRMAPELHRRATLAALRVGESLNAFIAEAIAERVRHTVG